MHDARTENAALAQDRSREGLDFSHRQLAMPATGPFRVEGYLGELAAAFAARGAGLATCDFGASGQPAFALVGANGLSDQNPWHADVRFLESIKTGNPAVSCTGPNGQSLLVASWDAGIGQAGLLWLESNAARQWSSAEAAALTLAGQVAANRIAQENASPLKGTEHVSRQAKQRNVEIAGQVTRRLAHDFGNVLTGILGFTELALAQCPASNTPLHTYLGEAHKAAQNGALFTHQLRLLSRRQAVSGLSTSLALFFGEEERRYRSLWGAGIKLTMTCGVNVPAIALDPEQLRAGLGALLENAREAVNGQSGGRVRVEASLINLTVGQCQALLGAVRPGANVEIRVWDNGAGLDPEAIRRVFVEPFFSAKPRKRGFGLTLAFGIANANRGALDLGNAPDGGAVARLILPATVVPSVAKPRILVVDDDPLILQFVCSALEGAGYLVHKASSAADAFASYTNAAPDLVLSDVAMPQESGLDLARRLLIQDARVRLLFMSGQAASDLCDSDLGAHQFQLLSKPFRTDGLLRAVRAALDRPLVAKA